MKHCKVLCRDETQHGEDYYLASQADSIIERLTARNVELEASAVNTDSMLADQAARFNEEIERLTAERDAAVECAAQEARYNNSLRDELSKNVVLTDERNAYQIAADKMAGEHKVERDALGRQIDALAKDAARMQGDMLLPANAGIHRPRSGPVE